MIHKMPEKTLAAHVRNALGTPSGRVLKEFLRTHCFMDPARTAPEWTGREQVEFRYGRMTLFQMLEFYADPANFADQEENDHD